MFDYARPDLPDEDARSRERIQALHYVVEHFRVIEGRVPLDGRNVPITVVRKPRRRVSSSRPLECAAAYIARRKTRCRPEAVPRHRVGCQGVASCSASRASSEWRCRRNAFSRWRLHHCPITARSDTN